MGNEGVTDEEWIDIPEYSGNYQVSNLGRVKSLFKGREQILKKTISDGKFKVQLYLKPGKFKNELVGRLVCRLFKGEPNENDVLVYRDGNKLNDKPDNLFWISRSESARTAKNKHRYSSPGASNGMAKLTPDKVNQIKELKTAGKSTYLIAQNFGISTRQVNRIVSGRTWKTV